MTKINLQILCQKIISGGQTGVDRGALDACLAENFACGGWCPKGRLAEDGRIDSKYPLKETREIEYIYRTRQNIIDSDGTLVIQNQIPIGGTLETINYAKELGKPLFEIHFEPNIFTNVVPIIIEWMEKHSIQVLNIAGPRKSEWENGYLVSYKITASLIKQIKNSTHG